MPSDRIGRSRTSRLGRLLGLLYFATIGAVIVVPIFAILAGIFLVIDLVVGFVVNRPVQFGRTIGTAPLRHHFKLAKWVFWGEDYPGAIPSAADVCNASV